MIYIPPTAFNSNAILYFAFSTALYLWIKYVVMYPLSVLLLATIYRFHRDNNNSMFKYFHREIVRKMLKTLIENLTVTSATLNLSL